MLKWQETTLRKGTKTPKICRDMFITNSRGKFILCEVKNGRQVSRQLISKYRAKHLIKYHCLVGIRGIFNNCYTYRTAESLKLIADILKSVKHA